MENSCMITQSECYVADYPVEACVACDYAPAEASNFTESSCVNVVQEDTMPKNMRFKPTRPVGGSTVEKEVASKTGNFKSADMSAEKGLQLGSSAYVVKSGDSLWSLAKQNGITVDELVSVNEVDKNSVLKLGQQLMIPGKRSSAGVIQTSVDGAFYTIAKGDTLSGIAARFHVSVDGIKKANSMKDSIIYTGKKIVIPGASSKLVDLVVSSDKSVLAKTSGLNEGAYQVKNGDSLSILAARFGVTVTDLMKWNNITDARKLRAGQTLVVKSGAAKSVTASEPIALVSAKIEALDEYIPEETDSLADGSFDFFEDDMLFDTSEEISVVAVVEE